MCSNRENFKENTKKGTSELRIVIHELFGETV